MYVKAAVFDSSEQFLLFGVMHMAVLGGSLRFLTIRTNQEGLVTNPGGELTKVEVVEGVRDPTFPRWSHI